MIFKIKVLNQQLSKNLILSRMQLLQLSKLHNLSSPGRIPSSLGEVSLHLTVFSKLGEDDLLCSDST